MRSSRVFISKKWPISKQR